MAATSRKSKRPDPKPPRGWKAGPVLNPVPDAAEPDPIALMQEQIAIDVQAGFLDEKEILEQIVDEYGREIGRRECRRLARSMLDVALEKHRAAERRWRAITDCERLDRAFAELERRGILARQNYLCCGTCGCAAIDDEMRKLRRKRRIRGYTFYHEQDTEAAVQAGNLFLNYGSIDFDKKASLAIGRAVMTTLRRHGLRVVWNGDLDRRLMVRVKWRRRRA